jgi:hypothetical protein
MGQFWDERIGAGRAEETPLLPRQPQVIASPSLSFRLGRDHPQVYFAKADTGRLAKGKFWDEDGAPMKMGLAQS